MDSRGRKKKKPIRAKAEVPYEKGGRYREQVEAHYQASQDFLKQESFKKAIESLMAACEVLANRRDFSSSSDDLRAYVFYSAEMAAIQCRLNEKTQSLQTFSRAVEKLELIAADAHIVDDYRAIANIYYQRAILLTEQERWIDAIGEHKKAFDSRHNIPKESLNREDYRDSSSGYYALAQLYLHRMEYQEAIKYYRCAIESIMCIPTKSLNRDDFRDIAHFHMELGSLFGVTGQPKQAKEQYAFAIDQYQSLAGSSDFSLQDQKRLASSYFHQAYFLLREGALDEAEKQIEMAIMVFTRSRDPYSGRYTFDDYRQVARFRKLYADILVESGKISAAIEQYDQSATLLHMVEEAHRSDVDFRELAQLHFQMGVHHARLFNIKTAFDNFIQALDFVCAVTDKQKEDIHLLAKVYGECQKLFGDNQLSADWFRFAKMAFGDKTEATLLIREHILSEAHFYRLCFQIMMSGDSERTMLANQVAQFIEMTLKLLPSQLLPSLPLIDALRHTDNRHRFSEQLKVMRQHAVLVPLEKEKAGQLAFKTETLKLDTLQEEMQAIKRENEKLRKENELLRKTSTRKTTELPGASLPLTPTSRLTFFSGTGEVAQASTLSVAAPDADRENSYTELIGVGSANSHSR